MAKSITLPVPLDRWFRDVKRIEELRKIMGDPTLQEAIATLKEIAGPTYGTVTSEEHANSNRLAWYAGYRDAFNDLYKLTRSKGDIPKPAEEWTHIQTPQ
tara:strand:+ start:3536 stop:3835 length:300 start_codon:yes stop_codon:yes gene_type:complete